MKRPVFGDIHTTTWAGADMEVVDVVEHPRGLGKDVHALIDVGATEKVPVVFLATPGDRTIERLQALVGKTVGIKMSGYFDAKQRFRPDTLNIVGEKRLRGHYFSPRARSA